jgi:hypothetical protein
VTGVQTCALPIFDSFREHIKETIEQDIASEKISLSVEVSFVEVFSSETTLRFPMHVHREAESLEEKSRRRTDLGAYLDKKGIQSQKISEFLDELDRAQDHCSLENYRRFMNTGLNERGITMEIQVEDANNKYIKLLHKKIFPPLVIKKSSSPWIVIERKS